MIQRRGPGQRAVRQPKGPGKNYSVDDVLAFAKNRLQRRDLLENIVEPSKVAANPQAPQEIKEIRVADVESRRASPVSLMPLGLIHRMNQDEVLDLLAYILAAGDPRHAMFR